MNIIPLVCLIGMACGQVAEKPTKKIELAPPESRALRPDEFALASESQKHMGTEFTIQFYYVKGRQDPKPAMATAFAKITALDKMMSDYDPESELSKLGASSPHEKPVPISEDLYDLLLAAGEVSEQTDGAFDVTVGPITKLWRQARRQKKLPDPERLREALAAVGYRNVEISSRTFPSKNKNVPPRVVPAVQLTKPKMKLDLGGIAQGYAADKVHDLLVEQGFHSCLVNASGDIRIGQAPPGKDGWKIGLTGLNPKGEKPTKYVLLQNAAISTSGDAFQFVEVEGKKYSHILDPKTGMGLTTPMSVTVISLNCTKADAYASALCVMGPEGAKKNGRWAVDGNSSALIVWQTAEGVKTVDLGGFKNYDVRDIDAP